METGSQNVPKVNILQVMRWLSKAIETKKEFLIRPNDIRLFYTIFFWEYLQANPTVQKIENDRDIELPEPKVTEIVQKVFDSKYYPCFRNIQIM
jgi:hypothetical protein